MSESSARVPVKVVAPRHGWIGINWRELWDFRELLYFLTWRDVKVRYKQTVLGATWAVLQPLLTMVVFSLFFGRLAGIPSDGVPYPLFSYAALVPWTLFATGLTQSAGRMVSSSNLIRKVYFPRMLLPASSIAAACVDFFLALLVLFAMMGWMQFALDWRALWIVPLTLLAVVTSLGAGLWLSALNVQFRDIRYTVPFLVQLWLFVTPIAYPSTLLPERWRVLYALNPMAGVVEGFRWALLGTDTRPGAMILVSSVVAVAMLVSGALFFRRVELTFADLV